MALFICRKCDSVENTAATKGYYGSFAGGRRKALCSACFEGQWHGLFPREKYDPTKHGSRFGDHTQLIRQEAA